MNIPIVEDFASIHARLVAIRDAERSWMVEPEAATPPQPDAERPVDFYAWLMGLG